MYEQNVRFRDVVRRKLAIMDEAESDGFTIYMDKVYGKVNGVSVEVCSIDDYPAYKEGTMVSDAQKRATAKYQSENVKKIQVKIFPKDHDLWEHYQSQPDKAEYIRNLIREDMSHHHGKE